MARQRFPQIIDGQFIHTRYSSALESEAKLEITQYSASNAPTTPVAALDSKENTRTADANFTDYNAQGQQFQWLPPSHHAYGFIHCSDPQSLETPYLGAQAEQQSQGQSSGHGQPYVELASQQGPQASPQFSPSQV